MQIRYRITITYTITVALILLLLCSGIYLLSSKDRTKRFRERLYARAQSISLLYSSNELNPFVNKIIQTSQGRFINESINIYGAHQKLILSNVETGAKPLSVPQNIINKVSANNTIYFEQDERDAVIMKNNGITISIAAYDDDRAEWLSKLVTILVLCFLVSISIVLIIGYFFSITLVRSISILKKKLREISSKDLSLRLNVGKDKDELEQLADAINKVLARLQHSFETQSRFIDNASHELSTPIAVILSQLDVARNKERSAKEYSTLIDSIHEDVTRLNTLLKTLLSLAKLSGSQKGIKLSPVRIDDLLMQIPSFIKKLSPDYKVKMLFEEFPDDEKEMNVYGNEALLLCALQNIVHNACKYSDDKTAVVNLNFIKEKIQITIKDNGKGIAEAELENIFHPFYRAANTDSNTPGIGLGLSLANNIIKLHGDNITVQSRLGEGTSFIISLTRDVAHFQQ